MGCAASAQGSAAGGIHRLDADADGSKGARVGILVKSAKNLRRADILSASDAYVLARLGKAGSAWGDKDAATERRSPTAFGDQDPEWKFGFLAEIPAGETAATWELQLRVFDEDVFTPDDPLGDVTVSFEELQKHEHEAKEYPLSGASARPGSTVCIMIGDRVEKAYLDEVERKMAHRWFPGVRATIDMLAGFLSSFAADPLYYANLGAMGRAWSRPLAAGVDPSFAWFKHRTMDPKTKEDTRQWTGLDGTEASLMLTGQPECAEILSKLGTRLGTNNSNGEVYHPNSLGCARQNPAVWPEVPWKGIGLSAPQEVHARIRPLLIKLCGPGGRWSARWLDEQASAFFRGRGKIDVRKDPDIWTARVLHEVFLGIKLTEAEGEEFVGMKFRVTILAGTPEQAADVPFVPELLSMKETLADKARWLERYKAALPGHLPESAALSPEDFTAFASAVMDALLFAGGASLPQVLSQALAIPWSQWGDESLPEDFSLCDTQLLPSYVWEVVRRFPPVSFVPLAERSYGTAPERNLYLNLQMCQRDDRVWGADAGEFRLRPIAAYHSTSVGFAEPAVAPGLADGNARACPAKDLALGMCMAFMREFVRTIQEAVEEHCPLMHRRAWIARAMEATDGVHRPLEPAEVQIDMYGVSAFLLVKDVTAAPSYPDKAEPAHVEMQKLVTLEELEAMRQLAVQRSKFDEVNLHTKAFIASVPTVVKMQPQGHSTMVGPPIDAEIGADDIWEGPFPGFRMILKNDEEETRSAALLHLSKTAGFQALDTATVLPLGEEKQVYFDSPVEAAVAIDITLGKYLPPQFTSWTDLDTDRGTVQLCVSGIGAWYLTGAKPADHEVPEGVAFEVNLEYMAEYETRGPWLRYGHTAYLGPAPADGSSSHPQDVLGIWVCHSKTLVRPGDAEWERAKAGFRCSLGTSITLKEHLAMSHWIIANQMQVAARETLRADSPVRRLLRQFYFATADINWSAKEILLPVNRFGFRTFGFSESGWGAFFGDIWACYAWKPFPEMLKNRDLPAAFLEDWPLKNDGELLWNTLADYVRKYLEVFYPTEGALLADEGVAAFWGHFDLYLKWKLPPLSRDSLVALLADLMWWATAGHEMLGSIVEYLPALNGLPAKLAAGSAAPDVQTLAQALILIALTGLQEPPLMADWTHIFKVASWAPGQQEGALSVVREFQAELERVSEEVDERNRRRERRGEKRFSAFNPRLLETSVSI